MRAFLAFGVGVCVGAALTGWYCVRVCVSLLEEDEVRFRVATAASQTSPTWWTDGPTRRRVTHPEA